MARLGVVEAGLRNLRPLMKRLGAFAVSESQAAFEEQSWDGRAWPERYPFQPDRDSFVNKAALVAHLNVGGGALDRFFDERPALMGTGELFRSLNWQLLSDRVVEVGSDLDYADVHNLGGESDLVITDTAKQGIRALLERRPELGDKLAPLLDLDELVTEVHQRQFVGVTQRLERDLADEVEAFFEEDR